MSECVDGQTAKLWYVVNTIKEKIKMVKAKIH